MGAISSFEEWLTITIIYNLLQASAAAQIFHDSARERPMVSAHLNAFDPSYYKLHPHEVNYGVSFSSDRRCKRGQPNLLENKQPGTHDETERSFNGDASVE